MGLTEKEIEFLAKAKTMGDILTKKGCVWHFIAFTSPWYFEAQPLLTLTKLTEVIEELKQNGIDVTWEMVEDEPWKNPLEQERKCGLSISMDEE